MAIPGGSGPNSIFTCISLRHFLGLLLYCNDCYYYTVPVILSFGPSKRGVSREEHVCRPYVARCCSFHRVPFVRESARDPEQGPRSRYSHDESKRREAMRLKEIIAFFPLHST